MVDDLKPGYDMAKGAEVDFAKAKYEDYVAVSIDANGFDDTAKPNVDGLDQKTYYLAPTGLLETEKP